MDEEVVEQVARCRHCWIKAVPITADTVRIIGKGDPPTMKHASLYDEAGNPSCGLGSLRDSDLEYVPITDL